MLALFALTFIGFLSFSGADKCSYESCPKYKPDMLNVHLVCHTHDDAGWLKTVDQYFWGANQSITKDGVQYILDTVLTELAHDPGKKFSYAESSFFWRWWNIQDDLTRHQVKKLVSQGQLEFIGGGWVQHDEATTHYAAIIDQMTIGHRFLNETFGRCGIPKVAWQIDPFGHSRESASLFAQMGLDALFFARIHHLDRDKRLKNKTMEMLWHGSDDLGTDSDILTSVFYQHYMPPEGFCFDEGCDDEPIMDDTRIEGYNVPQKVKDFIDKVQTQASSYATNHIMLTMGGDFQYMNADRWFTNLDKLIHFVNNLQSNGSKVNVFYSTPTCYAQAIINSKVKFPEKKDDFFPYANDIHSYWTGYFTSRPALKGFIRSTSNLFQICQTLDSIAQLDPLDWGDVDVLHRALGLVQHHDAVSGTAKQHVTNDYAKRLYIGIEECQQVANDAMKYLSPIKSKNVPPYHTLCTALNETVCNVSQSSNKFLVTVHNGLGKWLRSYVRIPVPDNGYSVYDPDGKKAKAQFVPTCVRHNGESASYQMIFEIELPPLGYNTYYVTTDKTLFDNEIISKKNMKKPSSVDIQNIVENGNVNSQSVCSDCVLKNNILTVEFDSRTGLLKSITEKTTNTSTKINQNLYWYRGTDDSVKGEQPSGAYIFRPNGTKNIVAKIKSTKKFGQTGDFVQEFWQTFEEDWVTQVIRIYEGKPYVEFEWTVGPILFQDGISREIVSVFQSDLKSGDTFYTDSNGRQMMERKRNFQPTYSYQDNEPISGNYYPVNTRITIKDGSKTITVLTDRSQGGSSLKEGEIELMVHRRLLQDDGFGVNEALNETGVDGRGLIVTGRHWLLLSKAHAGARKHRVYGQEMFYQPLLTFAPLEEPFDDYRKKFLTSFAGLNEPLPLQINFLTVAQWQGTSMILRLEHLFQKNEDHEMSRPVTVNLTNLFSTYDVVRAREALLSASGFLVNDKNTDGYLSNFEITLQPMQIRTFRVDVRNKLRRKSNRVRERFSDS